MNKQEKPSFVISQLEEALEERQTPDRRKEAKPPFVGEDRRKGNRRNRAQSSH